MLQNLAWKLRMVLKGEAGDGLALLRTYDAERRPAGRAVVDRATASYKYVSMTMGVTV